MEGLVSYKPVNPPIFSKKASPPYPQLFHTTPTSTPTTRDWRVYSLKPTVYAECTYRYKWHWIIKENTWMRNLSAHDWYWHIWLILKKNRTFLVCYQEGGGGVSELTDQVCYHRVQSNFDSPLKFCIFQWCSKLQYLLVSIKRCRYNGKIFMIVTTKYNKRKI